MKRLINWIKLFFFGTPNAKAAAAQKKVQPKCDCYNCITYREAQAAWNNYFIDRNDR